MNTLLILDLPCDEPQEIDELGMYANMEIGYETLTTKDPIMLQHVPIRPFTAPPLIRPVQLDDLIYALSKEDICPKSLGLWNAQDCSKVLEEDTEVCDEYAKCWEVYLRGLCITENGLKHLLGR